MDYILNTFKIDYPELKSVQIGRNFSIPLNDRVDTTYMVFVQFNDTITTANRLIIKNKLSSKVQYILKEKTSTKQDSIPVYILK
jgi:hypothetical protein